MTGTGRVRWGIVADDLTGAADAGAAFADAGLRVRLVLDQRPHPDVDVDVVIRVTEARAAGVRTATSLTSGAVEALLADGVDRLYVKVDSTVRGAVGAQIVGALSVWRRAHPEARGLVCPALPEWGRAVRAGRLLVDGRELADSPAAHDPVSPRRDGDVRSILDNACAGRFASLRRALDVRDAASNAELDLLAEEVIAAEADLVAIGSGGLASAIACRTARGVERVPRISSAGMVLVGVSSQHPASLCQIDALCASGRDDVLLIRPDVLPSTDPAEAARMFGTQIADAVLTQAPDAVVLVGGDGAAAALTALGARALDLVASPIPGCPAAIVRGTDIEGLVVVTRSGGFGAPDMLLRLLDVLREDTRPRYHLNGSRS